MSSRKPQFPSEKKLFMKKANVSSTVLDYYNKFGQNRDLERYLRVRRQNSSKSSSDSSLFNFERTNSATETEQVRKSLQKLNVSDGKGAAAEDLPSVRNIFEPEVTAAAADGTKPKAKSGDAVGEQIKIQKSLRKKSKSKSYNVSMESNIEINMPPPPPSHSLPELGPNKSDCRSPEIRKPKQIQFQSCETQTIYSSPEEPEPQMLRGPPIVPKKIAPSEKAAVIPTQTEEIVVETSPASSIASAKMRLEWDSMADVGYNRIIDFKSKSNSNLSTSEKHALTKFFAHRGLDFDDNLVIIASPDDRKLHKKKMTKSAIEMRQKSDNVNWHSPSKTTRMDKREGTDEMSQRRRDQWKNALMKYQQKYGPIAAAEETLPPPTDSLHLSMPQGHSTPLAIEGTSKSMADPVELKCVEKSCQTSLLYSEERKPSLASVGIQIDIANEQHPPPIPERIPIEKVEQSTQISDSNSTSTASFEYVAVDICSRTVDSSPTNVIELIQSTPLIVKDPNFIETEAAAEEKENVPPVEDKENIPPAKAYPRIEGEFRTPDRVKSSSEIDPLQLSTDESILPNELQRGIDLLTALIDSKKLDREAKKKLTRKIIRRLMKSSNVSEIVNLLQKHEENADRSDASSGASKSVASDHKTISGIATLASSEASAVVADEPSQKDAVTDWLKPATRSEIERERRSKTLTPPVQSAAAERPAANIHEFIEFEKQNHFKWIDQEIEHLRNLKTLMSNVDTDNNRLGSSRSLPERRSLVVYKTRPGIANADRPVSAATVSTSSKSKSTISEHVNDDWIHQSANSTNDSDRPRTSNSPSDGNQRTFPKWNSHLNLQKLVKNRTKLQTPSSDESIQSYAKARHAEFNRNYARAQGILYGNTGRIPNVYEQPLYTKPYSSDDYSECDNRGLRKIAPMKGNNVNAYTSATGSAAFLSSNSVSIAVTGNSTSNTTTHQYDNKVSTGAQTSGTLQRMPVIRMRKATPEPPKDDNTKAPTMRVHKFTLNKQQQARPEALAYVITFNEKTAGGSSETGSEKERERSTEDIDAIEHFTLQQYLQLRKPEFYTIAEERRKWVHRMNYLRQERNLQRKKLLAAYSSGSTLKMNMKRLLPPPPLAQTRLFTSKDIKANTRRKYRKLLEVQQKKIAEKEDKIRKNHRQLATIFNKNLQRQVLKGKTDLSNSITIT